MNKTNDAGGMEKRNVVERDITPDHQLAKAVDDFNKAAEATFEKLVPELKDKSARN
jgi:hypothetical protein